MNSIERCLSCPRITALLEHGIGTVAIDEIVRQVNYGEAMPGHAVAVQQPGGWTRCNAPANIQAALHGAAALLAQQSGNFKE